MNAYICEEKMKLEYVKRCEIIEILPIFHLKPETSARQTASIAVQKTKNVVDPPKNVGLTPNV